VELALVHLGARVGVVAEHDGEVAGGHGDLCQCELPILSSSRRLILGMDISKITIARQSSNN
jgi:hypothetical protein